MTQWLISFIFHLFLKDFPLFSSESCFSDFPHFQVLQWLCFLCHILLCRNWLVIERKTGSLRARVPQTLKCVHTWVGTACQHPARVIWSLCGNKLDDSIYRILGIQERNWTVYTLKGDWGGKGTAVSEQLQLSNSHYGQRQQGPHMESHPLVPVIS